MITVRRNISIPNQFSVLIIYLFAVAPFVGFISRSFFDAKFDYIMFGLCIPAVLLLYIDRLSLRIPNYILFLMLFTVYTILSDIFIVNKEITIKYFYTNELVASVLILIIVENLAISERFFNNLFRICHIILFIAFVVIIIQQFVNKNFFVDPYFEEILSRSAYSNERFPSIYSWLGANSEGFCFFPILGLLIAHHLKNNKKGIFYLYIIGAVVAFITKSRFIMVNYILLFFLIPVYQGTKLGSFIKYAVIVVCLSIGLYYGSKLAGMDTDKIINERILEKQKGGLKSGSASTRILAFKIFGDLYFKNPIVGKGYFHAPVQSLSKDYELVNALRGRSSQIHVGYLSLFYYYGLIGGTIYLFFLLFMTKDAYAGALRTGYWGPFFAVLQFLFINITMVNFHIFIMGFIISLVYLKYYIQSIGIDNG